MDTSKVLVTNHHYERLSVIVRRHIPWCDQMRISLERVGEMAAEGMTLELKAHIMAEKTTETETQTPADVEVPRNWWDHVKWQFTAACQRSITRIVGKRPKVWWRYIVALALFNLADRAMRNIEYTTIATMTINKTFVTYRLDPSVPTDTPQRVVSTEPRCHICGHDTYYSDRKLCDYCSPVVAGLERFLRHPEGRIYVNQMLKPKEATTK